MMSDSGSGVESSPVQNVSAQYAKIHRAYQQVLDRWTPFVLYRWLTTAGLLAVFFLRIVLAQGVSRYSLSSFVHHNKPDPHFIGLSNSGTLVCLFCSFFPLF